MMKQEKDGKGTFRAKNYWVNYGRINHLSVEVNTSGRLRVGCGVWAIVGVWAWVTFEVHCLERLAFHSDRCCRDR